MNRLTLAPSVDRPLVRRFAEVLRTGQRQTINLILLDFEGRNVRRPERKAGKDVGVRCIDVDAGTDSEVLCRHAQDVFGKGSLLYREVADEEIDICRPGPDWLHEVFGIHDLNW